MNKIIGINLEYLFKNRSDIKYLYNKNLIRNLNNFEYKNSFKFRLITENSFLKQNIFFKSFNIIELENIISGINIINILKYYGYILYCHFYIKFFSFIFYKSDKIIRRKEKLIGFLFNSIIKTNIYKDLDYASLIKNSNYDLLPLNKFSKIISLNYRDKIWRRASHNFDYDLILMQDIKIDKLFFESGNRSYKLIEDIEKLSAAIQKAKIVILNSNYMKRKLNYYFNNSTLKTHVLYDGFSFKKSKRVVKDLPKNKDTLNVSIFLTEINEKHINLYFKLISVVQDLNVKLITTEPIKNYFKKYFQYNNINYHILIKDDPTFQDKIIERSDLIIFVDTPYGSYEIPIQAMYAGIPIICADDKFLPEIAGDYCIYFDPFSHISLSEALSKIFSMNEVEYSKYINSLQERSKKFSIENSISELRKILEL